MNAPGKSLVANNVVRNLLCNSTSSIRGIYVRSSACTVSGNLVFDCRNSHDATDGCYAIQVQDAPNCHVVGNTIRDIHGFPNSDPSQAGIGVFLTRESSTVPNDAHIASNFIHGCDQGIFIEDAGTDIYRVMLSGNQVYDCGQLIYHGHCEGTDEPMALAETTPDLDNCTFARSADRAYEGAYSYKMTITSGGTDARAHQNDGWSTGDLHGLIAGVEYTYECWVYVPSDTGPAAAEVALRVGWSTGVGWTYGSGTATGQNAWEKLTGTVTFDPGATGAALYLEIASSATSGEVVYADNIRLYPTKNSNAHGNLLKDEGTDTRS